MSLIHTLVCTQTQGSYAELSSSIHRLTNTYTSLKYQQLTVTIYRCLVLFVSGFDHFFMIYLDLVLANSSVSSFLFFCVNIDCLPFVLIAISPLVLCFPFLGSQLSYFFHCHCLLSPWLSLLFSDFVDIQVDSVLHIFFPDLLLCSLMLFFINAH